MGSPIRSMRASSISFGGAAGALMLSIFVSPSLQAQTSLLAGNGGSQQSSQVLPPVSVTASPIQSDSARDFVPVTVLDQQDSVIQPGQTLGDQLFTQPGITSTTFAPGSGRPIIRGLDNVRVRIQENGIGSHDVSTFGEDHGVPIDPLINDRVEIVRGPAALRWGSQAIGGVVNAINNRIPTGDMAPGTFTGRLSGGGTTGLYGFDGAAVVDGRVGNFAVHADTFGRYSEDYRTPRGTQENSAVRSNGQSAGLSYIFDKGYIGTSLSRFASVYRIPGGEEAELKTRIDMEQLKWASRGEYRPDAGPVSALRFWLGYTQYDHDEIGLDHEDPTEPEHVHGSFGNREWEGRFEAQHRSVTTSFGSLDGALGLQFGHEKLKTTGEAAEFLAPVTTKRYAAYLFEELSLSPSLRFQAAGRIESVRIDGQRADISGTLLPPPDELENIGAGRRFLPFSGSLGVVQDLPGDITARLTAQYVQRAPTAAELYSRGGHHASGTFDIGNPNLKKESAKTVELGFARKTGRFRFDTSAFYSAFDGFIFKRLTGNTCDEEFETCAPGPGGEFDQIAYAQRDATFYGLEARGQVDVFTLSSGTVALGGRYDFVRAEFDNAGDVPRMPPHRLGGDVSWRSGAWRIGIDYLHAFRQDRTGEFETPTAGYNLVNAQVSYTTRLNRIGTEPTYLTFGISGTNLLDDDMRNSVSFKKDDVLLPGRSMRLFTTLTF